MLLKKFIALLAPLTLFAAPAFATDRDRDGVDDALDNCLWVSNPEQHDSNGDGYGNRCDADLNDDGFVSATDFGPFRSGMLGAHLDADFDGDGYVGAIDFGLFLGMLGGPPGPGAVTGDREPIRCNGGFCTIFVAPGIDLDVEQGRFTERANGDVAVQGDVEIYTEVGGVRMADVDLVVTPGIGMVGTSISPDYSIGVLEGSPSAVLPNRVDVVTALGRDLDIEIPLYDDVHYVVFSDGAFANASFDTGIGTLEWAVGPQSWRLVLDPVDPFLYVGSDTAIPTLTSANVLGLDFQEIGRGIGISLQGRIPFEPALPTRIEELLPEIQGDTIYSARFNATALLPLLETQIDGIVITEEDPDGNGALLFGSDAASARDYRRVIDGTIEANFVLSILPGLSFDIDLGSPIETGPKRVTLISSFTGVDTPQEKKQSWLSLGLEDMAPVNEAANGWLALEGTVDATVFYFSDDPEENFFRAASDEVAVIDSRRMAATHGVDAAVLAVTNAYVQIDRRQITFDSQSFAQSIHPDVTFTRESRTSLVLPTSEEAAFDLTIETESVIGGVSLEQYGMQLTIDAYRHWGRFETPHYAYQLVGSFSDEGAWLEGQASARLPYRYPAVDLAADLAGRIAAQEAVVALAQSDVDLEMDALIDLETQLNEAANDLRFARADLASARSWLREKRDALERHQSYDCGTCAWYDAVCWAEVGACNSWKLLAAPALEELVDLAEAGVSVAQASVNRLERAYDETALLVAGARRAVDLAVASRDEAQAALVALRANRDQLPQEDGVIDAVVRLRLTRDGLTGTVTGTFEGVDFGEGQVINDADGPRACFTVPQTNETLCADL